VLTLHSLGECFRCLEGRQGLSVPNLQPFSTPAGLRQGNVCCLSDARLRYSSSSSQEDGNARARCTKRIFSVFVQPEPKPPRLFHILESPPVVARHCVISGIGYKPSNSLFFVHAVQQEDAMSRLTFRDIHVCTKSGNATTITNLLPAADMSTTGLE